MARLGLIKFISILSTRSILADSSLLSLEASLLAVFSRPTHCRKSGGSTGPGSQADHPLPPAGLPAHTQGSVSASWLHCPLSHAPFPREQHSGFPLGNNSSPMLSPCDPRVPTPGTQNLAPAWSISTCIALGKGMGLAMDV